MIYYLTGSHPHVLKLRLLKFPRRFFGFWVAVVGLGYTILLDPGHLLAGKGYQAPSVCQGNHHSHRKRPLSFVNDHCHLHVWFRTWVQRWWFGTCVNKNLDRYTLFKNVNIAFTTGSMWIQYMEGRVGFHYFLVFRSSCSWSRSPLRFVDARRVEILQM